MLLSPKDQDQTRKRIIMKLCIALCVFAMAAVALARKTNKCEGNGRMTRQFNGRKEDTKMPCKYHAVRQVCGSYVVTVTPGNVYLHPKYRLDSLWLGVRLVGSKKSWEGRTDNKIAVKFINGWKDDLFNQKDGDLKTQDVLKFGKDSSKTWVQAKNGDFRVTFTPWDPDSKRFRLSGWKFECFSKEFTATGYPPQICGGEEKQEVADRVEKLGLKDRTQVIYYDVFTNKDITQMNPKCENATRIMTQQCSPKQRRQAILTCSQILSSYQHTKCVTKYSCDPMDVFVDCLEWVCSDFKDDFACERVGRVIDMCRDFNAGGLTDRVEKANCFKDFLPIKK